MTKIMIYLSIIQVRTFQKGLCHKIVSASTEESIAISLPCRKSLFQKVPTRRMEPHTDTTSSHQPPQSGHMTPHPTSRCDREGQCNCDSINGGINSHFTSRKYVVNQTNCDTTSASCYLAFVKPRRTQPNESHLELTKIKSKRTNTRA